MIIVSFAIVTKIEKIRSSRREKKKRKSDDNNHEYKFGFEMFFSFYFFFKIIELSTNILLIVFFIGQLTCEPQITKIRLI